MGLWDKKVKLQWAADDRVRGALRLPRPVSVVWTPLVDGRAAPSRDHAGEHRNLFGMVLGHCDLANGTPTAVVGGALHEALAMAGLTFVGPSDPGAALTFHGRLDALWADGRAELTAVVDARTAVTVRLISGEKVVHEQAYYGLGRAESVWAATQGVFGKALASSLAALVWYVATDERMAAAIRSSVP